MDNPLLVRMLDRAAHLDEQTQSLLRREGIFITVISNSGPTDQFHHEVRPAGLSGPSVKDLGDAGMIHQCQRLPLRLESGNDTPRVHPWPNDFQRDLAMNRLLLFRQVNHAATPFADLLQQFVSAYSITRLLADGV